MNSFPFPLVFFTLAGLVAVNANYSVLRVDYGEIPDEYLNYALHLDPYLSTGKSTLRHLILCFDRLPKVSECSVSEGIAPKSHRSTAESLCPERVGLISYETLMVNDSEYRKLKWYHRIEYFHSMRENHSLHNVIHAVVAALAKDGPVTESALSLIPKPPAPSLTYSPSTQNSPPARSTAVGKFTRNRILRHIRPTGMLINS